jgi:hypothetical protein
MKLSVAIAIAILAATQAFAQAPAGATPSASALLGQRRSLAGKRPMSAAPGSQSSKVNSSAALHQRIEDMQGTLQTMHTLMVQMRAKATKSSTKDPLVKANLDMWNLMVGHLDKQLEELKQTEAAREDMEARRAAMYKQADAKAAAEAQAARANMMNGAQTPATEPAPAPAAPAATPSAGAPAPAARAPAAAAAPASSATPTSSPN